MCLLAPSSIWNDQHVEADALNNRKTAHSYSQDIIHRSSVKAAGVSQIQQGALYCLCCGSPGKSKKDISLTAQQIWSLVLFAWWQCRANAENPKTQSLPQLNQEPFGFQSFQIGHKPQPSKADIITLYKLHKEHLVFMSTLPERQYMIPWDENALKETSLRNKSVNSSNNTIFKSGCPKTEKQQICFYLSVPREGGRKKKH